MLRVSGAEVARGAGGAEVVEGARGTGMAGGANVAGVAGMAGVKGHGTRSDGESDKGTGIKVSGVQNSMWLFTQSTNGLYWCNQRNPITAEMSGSRGVTRKLTSKTLAGVKWTGTVTSYKMFSGAYKPSKRWRHMGWGSRVAGRQ
jgi:hypothetical protein